MNPVTADDIQQLQHAAVEASNALEATLTTADQRLLARRMSDAISEYHAAYDEALVQQIIAHFPSLRLALLAIHDHVTSGGSVSCDCPEVA
jgi:hypothetical protein